MEVEEGEGKLSKAMGGRIERKEIDEGEGK
jgi:hypothetical protein